MSTSPDTAIFILDQLSDLGPLVRVQKMLGEDARVISMVITLLF